MSKESSIKEYISKAKKIINDDEKLKKLIEDVLKKLKEISKIPGTFFQKKVWQELLKIPKGQTRSYKEIAIAIGNPKAARAVANACGKNPYPIKIPCHRAIRSDGSIGGYSGVGGSSTKLKLLTEEQKTNQLL